MGLAGFLDALTGAGAAKKAKAQAEEEIRAVAEWKEGEKERIVTEAGRTKVLAAQLFLWGVIGLGVVWAVRRKRR